MVGNPTKGIIGEKVVGKLKGINIVGAVGGVKVIKAVIDGAEKAKGMRGVVVENVGLIGEVTGIKGVAAMPGHAPSVMVVGIVGTEMGAGGGYILAPAKSLQPGTPVENAAAVVEAFVEQ